MKAPKADDLPLNSLIEEQQQPIRRPPTNAAVEVMAGLLQREGLAQPLIGFRAGSYVKIVDGRLRLRALQLLAESDGLPLPDGTDRAGVAVCVLDPDAAYAVAARANAEIRTLSATERTRIAQVLASDTFYKTFVENTGIGRPPGVTRAIANLFERTTEGARLIRRTAEDLPPTAVCELMSTACDRDSSLKRIAGAVGDGTDVDTAIEMEMQGAKTQGRSRVLAGRTPSTPRRRRRKSRWTTSTTSAGSASRFASAYQPQNATGWSGCSRAANGLTSRAVGRLCPTPRCAGSGAASVTL